MPSAPQGERAKAHECILLVTKPVQARIACNENEEVSIGKRSDIYPACVIYINLAKNVGN